MTTTTLQPGPGIYTVEGLPREPECPVHLAHLNGFRQVGHEEVLQVGQPIDYLPGVKATLHDAGNGWWALELTDDQGNPIKGAKVERAGYVGSVRPSRNRGAAVGMGAEYRPASYRIIVKLS